MIALIILLIAEASCVADNQLVVKVPSSNPSSTIHTELTNNRVVLAKEVLEKIEKGLPAEYDNVTIIGDFELSKLDLPKENAHIIQIGYGNNLDRNSTIIVSKIRIINSYIVGTADFSGSSFHKSVSFENTTFIGNVSFFDTKFYEYADFNHVHFTRYAGFENAQFNGLTNFIGSNFTGIGAFLGAEFLGDADFLSSNFGGIAVFMGSSFSKNSFFVASKFQEYADFTNVQFRGSANFRTTIFYKGIDFRNTYFNKYVSFIESNFTEDALFGGSQFIGPVDFSKAYFGKKLWIDDAKFSEVQISWKAIKDKLVFNDAAYLSLMRNYENLGNYEDEDNCYYQYRYERQSNEPIG